MTQINGVSEVERRRIQQLQDQLGTDVMALMHDDEVFEVMVNGDGVVWTLGMGSKQKRDIVMTHQQRMAFLGTVASLIDAELNRNTPIIDGVLPWDGSRISGRIPPVDIAGPSFNIRKKARKVFTLDDYIDQKRVLPEEKDLIREAVRRKQNILIAGPTGSGKTTFTNAVLHALYEISPDERIITMEQVPELQVLHNDWVGLQTTETVQFEELVRNAMRGSPNRIIIGEVRDKAAHDLLKSWNTGHPGGITTIHADDCYSTLERLEDLIAESGAVAQQRLIARAIGTVFYIDKIAGFGPALSQIMEVKRYDHVTSSYEVNWIKREFVMQQ